MRTRPLLATALALVIGLGTVAATEGSDETGAGDAVVIAVVDNGFTPYHLDFRADFMPQHLDADPGNDLPLDRGPDQWLPGFPSPDSFASYTGLDLTLDAEAGPIRALHQQDAAEWAQVQESDRGAVHYYYAPGTKAVGLVQFGSDPVAVPSGGSHGVGSSSVSAGNLHGTCPECLVVFVTYGDDDREEASDWVMEQDWIDVVTNSYGFSLVMRDRLYSGSSTDLQRAASERGQTIFFSAGNGQANTFTAPNTTLFSSQEGPDWIVTVGATSPDEASFTGHGKPADISAPGLSYPSAPSGGEARVDGEDTFGGTSNSTPVTAGMYARALWWARTTLTGPARTQDGGVVAAGDPVDCGDAHPGCELGDGTLTAAELRTRLFHGAVHTDQGYQSVGLLGGSPTTPVVSAEHEFLNEGHGTYFARLRDDGEWLEEFGRIAGPMDGSAEPLERPDGEAEWFVVDSYCRQSLWGGWDDGAYREGETALPGPDPLWPLRSSIEASCPHLFPPA